MQKESDGLNWKLPLRLSHNFQAWHRKMNASIPFLRSLWMWGQADSSSVYSCHHPHWLPSFFPLKHKLYLQNETWRRCRHLLMETKLLLLFVILYAANVCCKSDVPVGYRVSLAVPSEYSAGFIGRAYLMETDQNQDRTAAPCFRVSLSVKSGDGIYFCSLELFLGDVKVWNSGHYSRFVVSEECVLELTVDGDLHLKDHNNQIGWRTGTAAQSVQVTNFTILIFMCSNQQDLLLLKVFFHA